MPLIRLHRYTAQGLTLPILLHTDAIVRADSRTTFTELTLHPSCGLDATLSIEETLDDLERLARPASTQMRRSWDFGLTR